MKHWITACWILAISVMAINADAQQKENYFQFRYGVNLDSGAHERYFIYENNTLKKWALGVKAVLADNDFQMVNPYVFYKLENGLQIGARYLHDSLGHEQVAPGIRYVKVLSSVIFLMDAAQYFDTKGDGHKTDIWFHISKTGLGWYYGAELWYFHTINLPHTVEARPLKIGYRFPKGLAPFVMYGYRIDTSSQNSHNIYGGIEFKF